MFYLREVSLDGKKANRFNRRLGYYNLYAAQVMRLGNCLTLLSSIPTFSLDNFKNTNLLTDMVRFVYWTFSEEFLTGLEDHLCSCSIAELTAFKNLLERYPTPYSGITDDEIDEELVRTPSKR